MPGPSLNPSHAFSLHNAFMRHKGFSFPFCRWANWHLEERSNYSKSWKLCNWRSTLSLTPNLVSNILNICYPFQVFVVHSNIKTIVSGYKCLSSHKELVVNFFVFHIKSLCRDGNIFLRKEFYLCMISLLSPILSCLLPPGAQSTECRKWEDTEKKEMSTSKS